MAHACGWATDVLPLVPLLQPRLAKVSETGVDWTQVEGVISQDSLERAFLQSTHEFQKYWV